MYSIIVHMSSKSGAVTTDRPVRGQARRAIVEATLELIARHGLDAVTHRRVAALAGVSPGSTTHHFDSREELVRASFRFYMELGDGILTRLDRELRATISDPAERVRELLANLIQEEFADARLVRAEYEMILFASTDSELGSYLRSWETRWIGFIAGDLEAAGAPRAVESARVLLNLTRGYELERLNNPDLDVGDFRRRIDTVLTSLLP